MHEFSEKWVQTFLQHVLGWSYHCETHPAQKVLQDWEALCIRMHAHIVYLLKMKQITQPDLIVNEDHTGVSLVPIGTWTWSEWGAPQVDTINHDEKRQVLYLNSILICLQSLTTDSNCSSDCFNCW